MLITFADQISLRQGVAARSTCWRMYREPLGLLSSPKLFRYANPHRGRVKTGHLACINLFSAKYGIIGTITWIAPQKHGQREP